MGSRASVRRPLAGGARSRRRNAQFRASQRRFGIDFERIHAGYEGLAHDLLTIEATGDVAGAEALLAAQGDLPATATAAIGRLVDVPVDIRPVYPVVEAMRDW